MTDAEPWWVISDTSTLPLSLSRLFEMGCFWLSDIFALLGAAYKSSEISSLQAVSVCIYATSTDLDYFSSISVSFDFLFDFLLLCW